MRLAEALLDRVLWDDTTTPVPLLWLGAQEPWWCWDGSTDRRLLVTAARVRARLSEKTGAKGQPRRATCPVFLDSGAYSWVNKHGTWANWPAREYADFVSGLCRTLGTIEHAGIQDWMCEAHVLRRTGGTVLQHQLRTVWSYLALRSRAPRVPWLPTLQGRTAADYLRHAEMYARAGVDLEGAELVGLGSVCRRSGTLELVALIMELVRELGPRVRLHGFGVKDEGALASLLRLASVDSMAWSANGRHQEQELRRQLGLPAETSWPVVEMALAADGDAVDLDLIDLAEWRSEHAPGGLANSQAFAERWRVRQLAEMCARTCELSIGAGDLPEVGQVELDLW